jgi:hypothetical protein
MGLFGKKKKSEDEDMDMQPKGNMAMAYGMKKRKKMAMGGDASLQSEAHEEEMLHQPQDELGTTEEGSIHRGSPKERALKAFAGGGMVDQHQSPGMGHTIHIHVNPQAQQDTGAMHPQKMAEGGELSNPRERGVHHQREGKPSGESNMGTMVRRGDIEMAKRQAIDKKKDQRNASTGMSPLEGLAEGGEVDDCDMVGRVMKKRQGYSEGGKVANEDSGNSRSSNDEVADAKTNEFDDLALDDDLEFHDTPENSGDEDDDDDFVGKIMKKRTKK